MYINMYAKQYQHIAQSFVEKDCTYAKILRTYE